MNSFMKIANTLTSEEKEALLKTAYKSLNRMTGATVADILDTCDDHDYQLDLWEMVGAPLLPSTPPAMSRLLYPAMIALYFIHGADKSLVTSSAVLALAKRA